MIAGMDIFYKEYGDLHEPVGIIEPGAVTARSNESGGDDRSNIKIPQRTSVSYGIWKGCYSIISFRWIRSRPCRAWYR